MDEESRIHLQVWMLMSTLAGCIAAILSLLQTGNGWVCCISPIIGLALGWVLGHLTINSRYK